MLTIAIVAADGDDAEDSPIKKTPKGKAKKAGNGEAGETEGVKAENGGDDFF